MAVSVCMYFTDIFQAHMMNSSLDIDIRPNKTIVLVGGSLGCSNLTHELH